MNSGSINLPLTVRKCMHDFMVVNLSPCSLYCNSEKVWDDNQITKLTVKRNKTLVTSWGSFCALSCCIAELKPEATGEMQSDPECSWELCSIYNARCTRLSSWINLNGMNASHWGYNMGGNRRVMSVLPSHWDRIQSQQRGNCRSNHK